MCFHVKQLPRYKIQIYSWYKISFEQNLVRKNSEASLNEAQINFHKNFAYE